MSDVSVCKNCEVRIIKSNVEDVWVHAPYNTTTYILPYKHCKTSVAEPTPEPIPPGSLYETLQAAGEDIVNKLKLEMHDLFSQMVTHSIRDHEACGAIVRDEEDVDKLKICGQPENSPVHQMHLVDVMTGVHKYDPIIPVKDAE